MPDAKGKIPEPPPLAELTKEARERIEAMGDELDRATADMEALEELGMDMSRLREHIEWSRHAREIVLKRFK